MKLGANDAEMFAFLDWSRTSEAVSRIDRSQTLTGVAADVKWQHSALSTCIEMRVKAYAVAGAHCHVRQPSVRYDTVQKQKYRGTSTQ